MARHKCLYTGLNKEGQLTFVKFAYLSPEKGNEIQEKSVSSFSLPIYFSYFSTIASVSFLLIEGGHLSHKSFISCFQESDNFCVRVGMY